VQPVLARREDGTVIGGHQRLVAARRLGVATVPVTYLDPSIEQARLLNLALNKISGPWDEQLLARLLADLRTNPAVDLTLSGFGEDEVRDLLRSLEKREKREQMESFDLDAELKDAAPTPRTKPGYLWALGEHRLLCGDDTKPEVRPAGPGWLVDGRRTPRLPCRSSGAADQATRTTPGGVLRSAGAAGQTCSIVRKCVAQEMHGS
jgi:hypothetical protein